MIIIVIIIITEHQPTAPIDKGARLVPVAPVGRPGGLRLHFPQYFSGGQHTLGTHILPDAHRFTRAIVTSLLQLLQHPQARSDARRSTLVTPRGTRMAQGGGQMRAGSDGISLGWKSLLRAARTNNKTGRWCVELAASERKEIAPGRRSIVVAFRGVPPYLRAVMSNPSSTVTQLKTVIRTQVFFGTIYVQLHEMFC